MSVIIARTISSVSDKRIVLSNSQFARPFPFGTNWNAVQIALRFSMRDSGANITGTPQFTVGACSGGSNLWGSATTTHAVGINQNSATWTRTTQRYATASQACWFVAKRINTTTTRGSATGNDWAIGNGAAADAADRTCLFVRITKGSPNFSFNTFLRVTTSTAPPADVPVATFLEQASVIGTPVITNHAFSGAVTLAVDEGANGSLDHGFVYWGVTTPEFEISDWAITRIS